MDTQPTTTDFLRQATHFVSYAAFLHIKRYGSSIMPPKSNKERVHWTDEEITALIDYLHSHRSEGEGGSFKMPSYQGAVQHIQPLHRQGGPKNGINVKEKFNKVSLTFFFEILTSYFLNRSRSTGELSMTIEEDPVCPGIPHKVDFLLRRRMIWPSFGNT